MRKTLTERFYKNKFTIHPNECWLWTACKSSGGYGCFYVGNHTIDAAHRVSYRLHKGMIIDGMDVLHTCDTPACVNPEHLFLGTAKDNISDMISKGRIAIGEKSGNAKFKEAQILEMRNLMDNGVRSSKIAKMFNTTRCNVSAIKSRLTWKHI